MIVEEVLEVLLGERLLGVDDVVQVGVHQLRDDVHVLPRPLALDGRQDVHQPQHVVVPKVAQDFDLAQQPLAVDDVLKRLGDLLDGDRLVGLDVAAGGDQAVGALAHGFPHGIVGRHLEAHAADVVALGAVCRRLVLLLLHLLVDHRLVRLVAGRHGWPGVAAMPQRRRQ